jgi:hypothetical protein
MVYGHYDKLIAQDGAADLGLNRLSRRRGRNPFLLSIRLPHSIITNGIKLKDVAVL